MRAILVGNYGVANFGDEALRDYFLQAFPEIDWIVVSAHPDAPHEIPRLPAGIRSFFGSNWMKTIRAIRSSDALVFGGGSLFTDVESAKACWIWWLYAKAAALFGKPVLFAFQGVGPFRTGMGEWFARSAFKKAAFISVRDAESAIRVGHWKLNTEVVQTFDPVFSLFKEEKQESRSQDVLAIIPRLNSEKSFTELVQNECRKRGVTRAIILSFEPDEPREKEICAAIQKSLAVSVDIFPIRSADDVRKALKSAHFVITARFHGAIAALAMEKKVKIVPQREGDKLDTLHTLHEGGELPDAALKIEQGKQALDRAFSRISEREG